jgi:trehalose 6-phosphate synthase
MPAKLVQSADPEGAEPGKRRLVAVSNRVADLSAGYQSGGLAVALADALRATNGLWFGWSGHATEDALTTPPKTQDLGDLTISTIDLTPEEEESYYYGYFGRRCITASTSRSAWRMRPRSISASMPASPRS